MGAIWRAIGILLALAAAAPGAQPASAAERLPAALAPPPVPEPPDPLPKGMDPSEALAPSYAPLIACAEAGLPFCQIKLGDVWNDAPAFAFDDEGAPAPRVWNVYEAERWYRQAAIRGAEEAFGRYGAQLCFRYTLQTDRGQVDDSLRLEGLSWVLLSIDLDAHFVPPSNSDSAARALIASCEPNDAYGPLGPVSEADIASASGRARALARGFGLE